MSPRRRLLLLSPCVGALVACRRTDAGRAQAAAATHDFYVWQQVWSPALAQALLAAATDVRLWRVRTLEVPTAPEAELLRPAVDWAMLAAARRPVVAVLRVAGNGSNLRNTDRLVAQLSDHLRQVVSQARAAAVPLAGIEIDHDCANNRLPAFAAWLAAWRATWQPDPALRNLPLSITALPSWLESAALPDLLRVPDESVLQVHAVQRPAAGLFDATSARQWARAWGAVCSEVERPFRLALPCYAHRVALDHRDKAVAVQSEGAAAWPSQATRALELAASPREVERLLRHLRRQAPASLAGCVWFRLPTDQDQRAWRLGTWQALVAGRALSRAAVARLVATGEPGLYKLTLQNATDTDLDLPAAIGLPELPDALAVTAQGQAGYAFEPNTEPPQWLLQQAGWLRPRSEKVVGWLRLPRAAQLPVHADQTLPTQGD